MRTREIKNEAKDRFTLNRYHAMLVYGVIYTILLNLAIITWATTAAWKMWWYGLILFLVFFLLLAPFSFGITDFYLKAYRYEKVDAFHIFDGFNKYNLERVIILHLIRTGLTICFTLLLIVPGIIFMIRSSMAVYLLRANPQMKAWQAVKASNKIMKGHCWSYFVLVLSFIGWFFLGLVTFGLFFVWLTPYFNTSKIVFYKRILQGDKKVYRTAENNTQASDGDAGADADYDEDDEKNIALRLMKLQLNTEIENMDRQMKMITSTNTNPNADKTIKSTNSPQNLAKAVQDVKNMIPDTSEPIGEKDLHITIPQSDEPQFHFDEKTGERTSITKDGTKPSEVALFEVKNTKTMPDAAMAETTAQVAENQTEKVTFDNALKVLEQTKTIEEKNEVHQALAKTNSANATVARPSASADLNALKGGALPPVEKAVAELSESDTAEIAETVRERLDRIRKERAERAHASSSRPFRAHSSENIEINENDSKNESRLLNRNRNTTNTTKKG